jgi:hypothetical protein
MLINSINPAESHEQIIPAQAPQPVIAAQAGIQFLLLH